MVDEEESQEGQWRKGIHCVHRIHKMYVIEEEASERSRESVESARSETQIRRTACAWTRSGKALEGEQERIHAGVVTQGMEGDGVDSLWRAMSVIEGGQGPSAEAKEMRERVVTAVEERLQAGEMQGETGWKEYVRKLVQGRRMGGPLEVEAWAGKNGYRVKVYRVTKDGEGPRRWESCAGRRGCTRWCGSTTSRRKSVQQERREEQARAGGHRLGWGREAEEDTVWRRTRVDR